MAPSSLHRRAGLRGLPIPAVALDYRYEPLTALHLIRRCCREYGVVNIQLWVPPNVLAAAAVAERPGGRMIEDMEQVRMTDAEVARDFAAVLEKVVRQGVEVVVEHDQQPVAVLRPAVPPRRKVSEVLALMPKDSTAIMDADFARDVEAAIESHREPLEPPAWD